MQTADNKAALLEIAVLTRNRKAYLADMLESLCAQTLRGLRVSVFDNASTDGTGVFVKDFAAAHADCDIRYFRNAQNVGQDGNFARAIAETSARYVAITHDDDVFHPRFFELALKVLQREPNIAFLSSSYISGETPDPQWSRAEIRPKYNVFKCAADFVAFMASGYRANFSASIYRRDALESRVFTSRFGKIGDRAVMADAAKLGRSAVLRDGALFFHREHSASDSNDAANPLRLSEIAAIHGYFRQIISASNSIPAKILYKFACAEDALKLLKFAKIAKENFRENLFKLLKLGVGGLVLKGYMLSRVGGAVRFLARITGGSIKKAMFAPTQKTIK